VGNTFSQVRVESDGSLYVNSYKHEWGRANWTKVHYKNACAYHLYNTYYNRDVFYVRGDGLVWTLRGFLVSSDSIYKTEVQTILNPLSKLRMLRGVKYHRKFTDKEIPVENNDQKGNKTEAADNASNVPFEYGLIAQEVEKVLPEAVVTLHDSTKAISYNSLIPVLIEAVKEQQSQIEQLQQELVFQEKKLNNIMDCCSKVSFLHNDAQIEGSEITESSRNILYQNNPNPFKEITRIKYTLANSAKQASINVYDMSGTLLKSFELNELGNGSVEIEGGQFKSGMYIYVLIVDGIQVDNKEMILTK
jgi:hypothetical protein